MGVSTDAILAYGVDLGEDMEGVPWNYWQEGSIPEGGEPASLEDWIEKIHGLKWREDFTPEERTAYHTKRQELIDGFPVEDIYHCSDEYPMLFLAVRGSRQIAARGYPKRIETFPDITANLPRYVEVLRSWGIDPYESAGWYLFSYWG